MANIERKKNYLKLENLLNFDAIFVSKYDTIERVLPSPLYLRSFSTFPLDALYPLNWSNSPPKSTQLLRDCYQNNATAEKKALIRETNYGVEIQRIFQLQLEISL